MVLYLCVLIVFLLHRESLKLILAANPSPRWFCHKPPKPQTLTRYLAPPHSSLINISPQSPHSTPSHALHLPPLVKSWFIPRPLLPTTAPRSVDRSFALHCRCSNLIPHSPDRHDGQDQAKLCGQVPGLIAA
jgi:hypothetical protein